MQKKINSLDITRMALTNIPLSERSNTKAYVQ